ncbi:hypothetical protein [Microbacterium sp.]|uniref:hypothetical protein n=1 Tax=Microbacterium sp. TaxID=51671 RepID=UPI003F98A71C
MTGPSINRIAEEAADAALRDLLARNGARPEFDGEDPWMTYAWELGESIDYETIKPLVVDAATRALTAQAPERRPLKTPEQVTGDVLADLDLGGETEGQEKTDADLTHACHSGWLEGDTIRQLMESAIQADRAQGARQH